MQWQGPTSDLNGAAIRERANKFVKELTEGYEKQEQAKDGTYAAYEDKSGGDVRHEEKQQRQYETGSFAGD